MWRENQDSTRLEELRAKLEKYDEESKFSMKGNLLPKLRLSSWF